MILSMLVSTMAVDCDATLIALALVEEDLLRIYSAATIVFIKLLKNILVVGCCCCCIQTMSPSTSSVGTFD